jgi:hypothetical protein
MIRVLTHAARCLRAACVFAVIASCDRTASSATSGPVTLAFRGGNSDSAGFGDVNVYPLDRDALARLRSTAPSLEDWQRILFVYVDSTAGARVSVLPLLGTYVVVADTLRFRPSFRPADGVMYTARFDAAALNARIGRPPPPGRERVTTASWRHTVVASAPSTSVRAIYPTGDVVPMNLLRMYVEFSAPMSSGRSYEFVRLYAHGDSLLEEPFFTAAGAVELWDPDHTRLTILFDPGRIKRDLKPHEEAGLPLREGVQYRLVIDSAWRDAEGRPLLRSYEKRFRVAAQDRALIRTADWRLTAPRVGTRDSLVLTFAEPLDRALLDRLLTVRDSSDARIDGAIVVTERETRWAFAPREPWKRGPHELHVDTELEDLAGNNLRKLFDVAPGDTAATGVSAPVVRVPFRPMANP